MRVSVEAATCWSLSLCIREGVVALPRREGRTGVGGENVVLLLRVLLSGCDERSESQKGLG